MSRSILLHRLALVVLFSLSLLVAGAPFDAPTTGIAPDFGPICELSDPDGCPLTDVACNRHQCCCVYTCSASHVLVGPCYPSGPIFPVTPDWTE